MKFMVRLQETIFSAEHGQDSDSAAHFRDTTTCITETGNIDPDTRMVHIVVPPTGSEMK